MRAFPTILVLSATLFACAPPKPVKVVVGEACERCRRPIVEERLAAEHVGANGFAVKFRTIHCMSTWLAQHPEAANDYIYVANYARDGAWLRATRASYVRVIVNQNTMERDFIAFADPALAETAARESGSMVVGWDDVVELGRTQPMGGN
jgi:nitrous oxide reductase accessory protein NosL